MWPRQILDLNKQFKLMIRLENFLEAFLQDVLKILEDVLYTSLKSLGGVLAKSLKDVLKTSWRHLQNVLKMFWKCLKTLLQDVLKMHSEEVWLRQIYSSWSRRLEDVFIKANVCWVNSLFDEYFLINPNVIL